MLFLFVDALLRGFVSLPWFGLVFMVAFKALVSVHLLVEV